MTGNPQRAIYWDTCIFLAWLKDEHRYDPLDLQGIQAHVESLNRGQIQIVTSTLTLVEVLQSTLDEGQSEEFSRLFRRQDCHLIPVSIPIARIASEIRNHYKERAEVDELLTVSTPDAIHLATAIWFPGCSELYTFDEVNKKGRPRALIPLSGTVAAQYPLVIAKPTPGQLALSMTTPATGDDDQDRTS